MDISMLSLLLIIMINWRRTASAIYRLLARGTAFHSNSETKPLFQQSNQIWREPQKQPRLQAESPDLVEVSLLNYIMEHCPKNNPQKTIEFIDKFCQQNWMMNVGPEKSKVFEKITSQNRIGKILEIGGYCGYSSLVLSQCKLQPNAQIISIQTNKNVAQIAKKILAHAGITKVQVLTQSLQQSLNSIKQKGPFDLVFLDHDKPLYLQDLKFLEENKLIDLGGFIVADNIIYPGAPDYHKFMRDQSANEGKFKSTLYRSYDGYTDIPDAIMVSQKIK